jgi:hypothetical protein
MDDFIEQRIITAVRKLLTGRVNEILANWKFLIPVIEFGNIGGGYATAPVITLSSCERTEKERIIRLDAYSLTISFSLQEHPDGELYCYGYAHAAGKALGEDVTLGGVADRAVISGTKYVPPKKANCGVGWGVVISLRVTVETMNSEQ